MRRSGDGHCRFVQDDMMTKKKNPNDRLWCPEDRESHKHLKLSN